MKPAWEPPSIMTIRRWIKLKIAELFLRDEIAALNDRNSHASGALSDILTLVTDGLPKMESEESRLRDVEHLEDYEFPTSIREYVELHKVAEAVLSRILCSADRVRSTPSYFRHEWEEKLWAGYLGKRIDACATREPCLTVAGKLSDRVWHVSHIQDPDPDSKAMSAKPEEPHVTAALRNERETERALEPEKRNTIFWHPV